jgi:hypothetical protein
MSKFNFARFADANGISLEEQEDQDVLTDARLQKDVDVSINETKSHGQN